MTKRLHSGYSGTLRRIDVSKFRDDVTKCSLLNDNLCDTPVNDLVDAYNQGLQQLIEDHAPMKTKYVTFRPDCPWYSDELRTEKQK